MSDPGPVEQLLETMTLAEKLGQMTQVSEDSITPDEVREHFIGSVLSGGNGNPSPNNPQAWVDLIGGFAAGADETRLGVPLLYGVDAVHGHSNVRGATVFPHNIGLGAIDDAELVRRIGRVTAREMAATGANWAFAPCVAVPQDIRWGRTYEGYGRDSQLVSRLGAALVTGLQASPDEDERVMACPKHYLGDGGTTWASVPRPEWLTWWDGWGPGWQMDQGDTRIDETELREIHLTPYRAAVDAGAMSVMVSYSSWNGAKLHGHRSLLTDVLKGELGFGGFVVSDWMGIDQLDRSYDQCVIDAINAGIDMVMVPLDYQRFIDAATRAVTSGAIPIERIEDAVRRILGAKAGLGLFAEAAVKPPLDAVGHAHHRRLAAEAARRSCVLLKDGAILPIDRGEPIDVAGSAADDIGLQCGGWTVGWQGSRGPTTQGTTFLAALREDHSGPIEYAPDGSFGDGKASRVGIVCIAEQPYAEGPGDSALPEATQADRELVGRMRLRCDRLILVIFSGRPLVIPELIAQADAVVAAWLPGTEATQIPGLLNGSYDFGGRLPQPWPESPADLASPDPGPHIVSTNGA
jgi:beta-glucosidase